MILRVKATPNASRDGIVGWQDVPLAGPVLCVKVRAPAVDGKANKALIRFLANTLKIPKSSVTLLKGASSRIKTFEIPDNTALNDAPD